MSRLLAVLTGIAITGASTAAVEARPPGGRQAWLRSNYADREVSLLGGPVLAAAVVTTTTLTGGRSGRAAAVASTSAALFGALDDHRETDTSIKGLTGHLTALTRGKVTTGAIKIVGITFGSLAGAAMLPRCRRSRRAADVLDLLMRSALIAGSANLINLFDLRPGRGLKAGGAVAALLAACGGQPARSAGGTAGVALAALRDDLAECTMLGDTGANALGASLGTALAAQDSRWCRGTALAAIVGLTLLSEKFSFSRVIEETRVLSAIDRWGRR